ncbi:MAG: hypothetical protein ACI4R8_03785 [Candidatus Caccovivens sp.]
MSKVLSLVFLIFGTVVGSGFSSGKEIMVFFARFGPMSYFYILMAGLLFFFIFYFFLIYGKKVSDNLDKSKWLSYLSGFMSLVFCSSMFAGIKSLFGYFPDWIYYLLMISLVVICVFVTFRGIRGLERINLILMPVTSVIFLAVLFFGMSIKSNFACQANSWAGILYCPLYVVLNTSTSGFVIAKAGDNLSKKQTVLVSLFSTFLLVLFLMLGNFVLQQNSESFLSDMPFLYIASNNPVVFCLAFVVILVGCFTTLISLMFTLKNAFKPTLKSDKISTLLAVFLPLFISGLGFSQIVSFLYPICSVLGVLILLFSIFSFEQTDGIIHQKRKDAKNKGGGHH